MVRKIDGWPVLIKDIPPDPMSISITSSRLGYAFSWPCHTGIVDEVQDALDDFVVGGVGGDVVGVHEVGAFGEGLTDSLDTPHDRRGTPLCRIQRPY
jgi:hypothetical protein